MAETMADLASAAEKVETSIGLPPLPDPPESTDDPDAAPTQAG